MNDWMDKEESDCWEKIVKTLDTLSRLKHTTKLKCTITCVIYWLSAKLGTKKEIEISKYIKYDVSASTWVKISNFWYAVMC